MESTLVDKLLKPKGIDNPVWDEWSEATAKVWERARFRCEYCDKYLLETHEFYRQGEVDHILPKSKHPELKNNLGNYALSCTYCNRLKSTYEPPCSEDDIRKLQVEKCDKIRIKLIKEIREKIKEIRLDYAERFIKLRKMMEKN